MEPIPTPMCCGSNTVRPDSVLKSTGNFTRMSAGGSFKAKNVPTGDVYPPSKVTDLKVQYKALYHVQHQVYVEDLVIRDFAGYVNQNSY